MLFLLPSICVLIAVVATKIIYCSMAAAFGSGAMFSLVSGMGGPNQAANAVTSGLFFALVQGGLFQVSMKKVYLFSIFVNQNYFVPLFG